MTIPLPLKEMTLSDKLMAMEQLWEDLCGDPESIPSPEWHKHVLEAREQKITEGKANFYSLDDSKKRINDQIK